MDTDGRINCLTLRPITRRRSVQNHFLNTSILPNNESRLILSPSGNRIPGGKWPTLSSSPLTLAIFIHNIPRILIKPDELFSREEEYTNNAIIHMQLQSLLCTDRADHTNTIQRSETIFSPAYQFPTVSHITVMRLPIAI